MAGCLPLCDKGEDGLHAPIQGGYEMPPSSRVGSICQGTGEIPAHHCWGPMQVASIIVLTCSA